MLHTDDITPSVTDTYYYNVYSNETLWINLNSVTYCLHVENKSGFVPVALFHTANLSKINQHFFIFGSHWGQL